MVLSADGFCESLRGALRDGTAVGCALVHGGQQMTHDLIDRVAFGAEAKVREMSLESFSTKLVEAQGDHRPDKTGARGGIGSPAE